VAVAAEPVAARGDQGHRLWDLAHRGKDAPPQTSSRGDRLAGERKVGSELEIRTKGFRALAAVLEVALQLALVVRLERPKRVDGDESEQFVMVHDGS